MHASQYNAIYRRYPIEREETNSWMKTNVVDF
jgi:hypothetical protein